MDGLTLPEMEFVSTIHRETVETEVSEIRMVSEIKEASEMMTEEIIQHDLTEIQETGTLHPQEISKLLKILPGTIIPVASETIRTGARIKSSKESSLPKKETLRTTLEDLPEDS